MRLLLSLFACLFVASAWGASDLVDVNKNSKLSDYFKKINSNLSANSEEKSIEINEPKETLEDLAEVDIPLKQATVKDQQEASLSPFQKTIMSVIGLLCLALVVVIGMQRFSSKTGHADIAKNITVLTQKSIGPKKNLMLIRIAGETILLGVTDSNINHIKTLSLMDDEIPDYTEPKFSKQLKEKISQTKQFDEDVIEPIANQQVEEVDGFSVSRLDDVKQAITKRFSV